jgi:hypothetical protein
VAERQEIMDDGYLITDLPIRQEHGTLILPAGSRLRVSAVIHEPEISAAIVARPPDLVIEYRVLIVADGIRLESHKEIPRG